MTEAELVQRLRQQLQSCAGFEGDELTQAREQALDYYFQRARGDEVIGRSQVVSGDLSAMVEANLAQMLDAFSGDEIVEFPADGPGDEDQATLESFAVTELVMGRQNGYLQFATAIKDALLLRNGIVKVWVDQKTTTRHEDYTGVTHDALAELTNRPGIECEIKSYNPENGSLRLRCTETRQEFRAEALPPENFVYLFDWDRLDLQDIPFCAERHISTRSEMIQLGFPRSKVRDLPKYFERTGTTAGAARNPLKFVNTAPALDESQELVEWWEAFVLMDAGNGTSERRRIAFSHTSILADDPRNLVPYAAGSAILAPHRFTGISLHDKLRQVQDISTGLQRALMDNVNTTTKNRIAYLDGRVNVDDVSDGRPNGAIRVKNIDNVAAAIMPFAVPDTSANILANIEFQKSVRTEMGGAALDLASGAMQLNDRVGSQGLDRAYSVMEQLAAMMTRIIANSLVRNTFLLAHATIREYFTAPIEIKREGKWITANPAEWPERLRCTVKPGMSPGERQRRAGALMQILNSQIQLAERGMDEVLVNIDGFYAVLMDWARANEIANPEQYFRDPQSPEAQQALQQKQQQAQQQDQQKQALMQQAIELEQIRAALDKYRHDSDLQFKYWAEVLGAEVEEAKIVGSATTELVKAKAAPKNGTPTPG